RDRGCPSRDLHDVAGPRADAVEVRVAHARDGMGDVLDPRLRDPQGEGAGEGRRGELAHGTSVPGPPDLRPGGPSPPSPKPSTSVPAASDLRPAPRGPPSRGPPTSVPACRRRCTSAANRSKTA